jgi:hypothetical protein
MRRVLGLLLSTMVFGGCDNATESQRLGLYAVQATRTANTCGAQFADKLPGARFNVALSLRRGVLTWTPETAVAASGSFDVFQGTFRLALESSILKIAPDRRRQVVGCMLHRVDVIEGAIAGNGGDAGVGANLDAGITVTGFRAQETIAYGVESGDCEAAIGVGAGQALALPCVVGYQFEATRVGP